MKIGADPTGTYILVCDRNDVLELVKMIDFHARHQEDYLEGWIEHKKWGLVEDALNGLLEVNNEA